MPCLLFYESVPDYLQRRPLYRSQHLRAAWEAHERELILAGALDEPTDAAVLLFAGDDDSKARALIRFYRWLRSPARPDATRAICARPPLLRG